MGIGTNFDDYRKTDPSIAKMPNEQNEYQLSKLAEVRKQAQAKPSKDEPVANADLPKKGK